MKLKMAISYISDLMFKINLLFNRSVGYIVIDKKLENAGKSLPKGIKVRHLDFAGSHNYFLLSKEFKKILS